MRCMWTQCSQQLCVWEYFHPHTLLRGIYDGEHQPQTIYKEGCWANMTIKRLNAEGWRDTSTHKGKPEDLHSNPQHSWEDEASGKHIGETEESLEFDDQPSSQTMTSRLSERLYLKKYIIQKAIKNMDTNLCLFTYTWHPPTYKCAQTQTYATQHSGT